MERDTEKEMNRDGGFEREREGGGGDRKTET